MTLPDYECKPLAALLAYEMAYALLHARIALRAGQRSMARDYFATYKAFVWLCRAAQPGTLGVYFGHRLAVELAQPPWVCESVNVHRQAIL